MRAVLVAIVALAGIGCSTFDPKHPMAGAPTVEAGQPTYWVWVSDGRWHLRVSTATGRPHRFQGSIAGVNGGITELMPTRPDLKDRIALVGDAVQFDLEAAAEGDGFDARVVGGGCVRLDLYIDGHYRPERVRLGPRALTPRKVPFERCP